MDHTTLEACLMTQLVFMRERLDEAASLARAAETCGKAGNIGTAIEIALEVEQLTYEVNILLNAASLMQRLCRA